MQLMQQSSSRRPTLTANKREEAAVIRTHFHYKNLRLNMSFRYFENLIPDSLYFDSLKEA